MPQKKSSRTALSRSKSKRTSTKQRRSLFSRFMGSRKAQLIFTAVVFGAIGTYLVVDSYADSTIGIHIAPRATNLTSQTDGPRAVNDSTAAKRNVKSVYVARSSGSAVNQVSVTQALDKGTYEVCTLGRPTSTPAAGKLRVSDKPYGTTSALTVEQAFKTTSTAEYVKLACPVITLPSNMTVYISHVVTEGAYNFSVDAIVPVAASSVYPTANTTGVPAGVALTKSTRTRFDKAGEVVQGLDLGCVEIAASNVTIKNSRITCVNSQTGNTAGIDGTHWSNAFSGMVIENVTVDGVNARAIELNPNGVVRNVKIVGQGRGIAMAHGATVENSYISLDNSNSNCDNAFGGGHATAIAFFSAHDVTVKNNHIEMRAEKYPADACISGLVAVYPENQFGGPSYNVVFDHNRFVKPKNDGHYHVSLSYSPEAPYNERPNNRIQLINNRFEGGNGAYIKWNSYPQTGDVLKNNQWCPNAYGSTNGNTGCTAVNL